MKIRVLQFVLIIVVLLPAIWLVACGDDDDDDDEDSGYSCGDAAEIIYDDCEMTYGGMTKEDFIAYCSEEGIGPCEAACIDQYKLDGDCDEAYNCALNCA